MAWKKVRLGDLITESRVPSLNPDANKRIKVKLKVLGVEKRPLENEIEGATKQFVRQAGQFIYGKQNFHKGAFGIIPKELNGYETSADLPAFDVNENCIPEWIFYFFKQGGFYLELAAMARGVATQRIHPEQIYDLEVPLPDIETQRKILLKLKSIEEKAALLSSKLSFQLTQLENLNQAILQEAVQGKLVNQDKKDEPASELLKRIKAEKAKSGKKEKPLPPIKTEEIPFEIPESWVWCRLGDAVDLKRGKSKHRPRNDDKLFLNGVYPFIQTGDVSKAKHNNDLITTINGYYNDFGLAQSEMQPKGSLCITIAANIAECGFLSFDACVPDSIVCLIAIDKCIENFVYHYLKLAKADLERFAPATAQKNINLGILNDLLIPFPPLSEQKRIVVEIEKQLAKTKQLKEHIIANQQATEQLLKALLHQAFEVEESVGV